MKRWASAVLAIGVTLGRPAHAAQDADAVVVLWVDGRALGTGFFISDDGRILTAYHVIEDAHSIRVLHKGLAYGDVVIERWAPEYDLAILQVPGITRPTPFLRLSFDVYEGLMNEELVLFGHAAGIRDQRIVARLTRPGFVSSGEIRGLRGERLFARGDVRLLSLQAVIYNGISGGPVSSRRGVIGVLSGSLEEGGAIAWAIPSEYARTDRMRAVGQRVEEIAEWPPLALMAGSWKNLRRRVPIDDNLAEELDRYFAAADRYTKASERIPELGMRALPVVHLMRTIVGDLARTGSNDSAAIEYGQTVMGEMEKRVVPLAQAWDEWASASVNVAQRLLALQDAIEHSPSVARDPTLLENANRLSSELAVAWDRHTETFRASEEESKRLLNSLAHLPETRAGLAAFLGEYEAFIARTTSPEMIEALSQKARIIHRVGKIVESLVQGGPEADAHSELLTPPPVAIFTTYNDPLRGFSVEVPRRWEQRKDPRPGTAFQAFSPLEGSADTFSENVLVIVERMPGKTLDGLADEILRATRERTGGVQLLSEGRRLVNGQPSRRLVLLMPVGGVETQLEQYFFYRQQTVYILQFTAEQSAAVRFRNLFERILNSFTLVP